MMENFARIFNELDIWEYNDTRAMGSLDSPTKYDTQSMTFA
jgi:hypothetical protein